jgi:hypothetical protein
MMHGRVRIYQRNAKAARLLDLPPAHHTEEACKRVLGGCDTVVDTLGTLRTGSGTRTDAAASRCGQHPARGARSEPRWSHAAAPRTRSEHPSLVTKAAPTGRGWTWSCRADGDRGEVLGNPGELAWRARTRGRRSIGWSSTSGRRRRTGSGMQPKQASSSRLPLSATRTSTTATSCARRQGDLAFVHRAAARDT